MKRLYTLTKKFGKYFIIVFFRHGHKSHLSFQRNHERSQEQEKIEKQRQMPFHMHINLEMLECVYLVSAMLLEIPYMAAHEFDARRRMISKSYYQQLRSSERQSLVGPPESMREHIVAASKAMKNGNWVACKNFIINEKMNTKVSSTLTDNHCAGFTYYLVLKSISLVRENISS